MTGARRCAWTRRRWCCGVAVACVAMAARAELPAAERRRIERLLAAIERDTQLRFDRNGTRVGGADAARFLRAKWARQGEGVATAEAFIERIASRSSTSGRAYLVCGPAGDCTEAGAWLTALLRRLDAQTP